MTARSMRKAAWCLVMPSVLVAGAASLPAVAADHGPSRQEMARQLRAQAREIQRLREELDRLKAGASVLQSIEVSREALERQQQQVDSMLKRLEENETAGQARVEQLQQEVEVLSARADHAQARQERAGRLSWSGYGSINYQRYDFFENAQDATPERRAKTDLERVVLAPRYDFGNGYSFVAEIEFEHGGTGSTVEFEPEEAGEFEVELEKGGEILLEQAYVRIDQNPNVHWRLGEIIVPFGMVNSRHAPDQYFTVERSLAETQLIPSTWHETGVQFDARRGDTRLRLLWVTGLDSTGFNGYQFVANGMQNKLEFRNASGMAWVGRIDHTFAEGVTLGGAVYYGDTSKNRPRRNMNTDADLFMAEVHGRYERGPVTLRSQYLYGHLKNAGFITRANYGTFNGNVLGVSRHPVGSRAKSFFVEGGYDVFDWFPNLPGRLDLFARWEMYDTHAGTARDIVRESRFDRRATTVGLNYKPYPGLVFKAEYSRRTHAGTVANKQDFAGLSVGFRF